MHKRILTEIETAMSNVLVEHLAHDIEDNPFISLLIDESTGLDSKKHDNFCKTF